MKKRKIREPWKIDLDLLTPNQISRYNDSLEVLRNMRKGKNLTHSAKEVGIGVNSVKKYIKSAIKAKNGILVPKITDTLIRQLRIYEDGLETWIQVKGIKKASIIGKYHSAIGKLVDNNERTALDPFKDVTIKDIKGKIHKLETNRKKIFEIFDRREVDEYFNIYRTG